MGQSLPANEALYRLVAGCELGADVVVHAFANLYGCRIGAGSTLVRPGRAVA